MKSIISIAIIAASIFIADVKSQIVSPGIYNRGSDLNVAIRKDTNMGKYDMPFNFSMTFKIKPLGKIGDWANIVHVTKTGNNMDIGGRIPAIFIVPNSYTLHVRVGSDSDWNFGLDSSQQLPEKAVTDVKVDVIGTILTVYFNGTSVGTASCDSRKNAAYSGTSTVYIADPWYLAANAGISDLQITTLPNPGIYNRGSDLNVAIRKDTNMGKYDMPFNFSMTFKIKPLGKIGDWANIVHVTKTGNNMDIGGRIPAIFIVPNSYTLHVRVGSDSDWNFGLDSSQQLPEKAVTDVKVDVIGTILTVYFNGTSVGTASCDSRKNAAYSGTSTVYIADPWYLAANAGISDLQITTLPNPGIYNRGSDLNVAIRKDTNMGKYDMPFNFSMTFKIKPLGKIGDWANIVHVTKTGNNMDIGGRIPAIFIVPNSYTLHVRVGSDSDWNFGLDSSQQLPEKAVTDVKVDVIGTILTVYFNGTSVGTASCDSRKNAAYSGTSTVYIADPWYLAANAGISDLQITTLPNPGIYNRGSDLNVAIRKDTNMGKYDMPFNFSMTFKIKPLGKIGDWANIVHVTKTGNNMDIGGRIPAIFIVPNSYTLHVRVGSDSDWNFGLDSSQQLPEKAVTDVKVDVIGTILTVYFNGTSVGTASCDSRKNAAYSGTSTVYIADPWYLAANAGISDLQITTIPNPGITQQLKVSLIVSSDQLETMVSAQCYPDPPVLKHVFAKSTVSLFPSAIHTLKRGKPVGTFDVPEDYTLQFEITPFGYRTDYASILHFTSNDQIGAGTFSQLPGLYFMPKNTTILFSMGIPTFYSWDFVTPALPLKKKTTVKLVAVDKDIEVYYNGLLVHTALTPFNKISGLAKLYVSNGKYEAADANITKLIMTPGNYSFTESLMNPITKNTFVGKIDVPFNFALLFSIKPLGIVSTFSNIVHLTKDGRNCCNVGSRVPGIFFSPSSTNLSISVGSDSNGNFGLEAGVGIPLNTTTRVKVEIIGQTLSLFLNETLAKTETSADPRGIAGLASAYIGDPWHAPANALISSVHMHKLDYKFTKSQNLYPISSYGNVGQVYVPPNFAMEFLIKPLKVVYDWANVMLVTIDGEPCCNVGSRTPNFEFASGKTRLIAHVGIDSDGNFGIESNIDLPLNAVTKVTLRVSGTTVQLFLNGTMNVQRTGSGTRTISGNATAYIGSPWLQPSNALVSEFTLTAIK